MPDAPQCPFILLSTSIPLFLLCQHAQLSPARPGEDPVRSQRCICMSFSCLRRRGLLTRPNAFVIVDAMHVDLVAL